MKVATKLPGKDWEWKDINPNLENLQKLVGGYIELLPNSFTNAVIYADEEGKIKGLANNFDLYEDDCDDECIDRIVGPVVMLGPYDEHGKETELTEELFNKTIKCMEPF